MRRVLKWTVEVDDEFHSIGDGRIVHVDSQFGERDRVQVWTEQEVSGPVVKAARQARVFGTGQPIPDGFEHIGSVIPVSASGHLVWHVYAEERGNE